LIDLPLTKNVSFFTTPINWVSTAANGNDLVVAVSYPAGTTSQVDIYRSNDGGNQWSLTFGVTPALPPIAVIADPNGTFYLAAKNLLTSTDHGATWTTLQTTTTDFHTVVASNGALLAAGEKGIESHGRQPRTFATSSCADFGRR